MQSLRWETFAMALAVALLVPAAIGSPAGADSHVVTIERPGVGFGYAADQIVADSSGTLTLTNLDLRAHDVVSVAFGPSGNPWCGRYAQDQCPLFASPLIGLAQQAVVEGIEQLTPLESYEFYCSIHLWMTGTIIVV